MDPIQLSHLHILQKASQTNRLVPFVGAGVSANSGVPMWKELIDEMKKGLPSSVSSETDDLKVAQVYKDVRGEKEYLDKVKEILRHNKVIPNPIHEAIFELNPVHVVTTNYDDLLEQELENEFKQYDIIREDLDLPNMTYSSAVVKMHGDFQKDNIVLTETDYYNYAKNFPLIRAFVQSIFSNKLVVFIGFSFNDLNLKMILNEVKNILGEKMQRAYLISLTEPDSITIKYFEKRHINIVYLKDNEMADLLSCLPTISFEDSKISSLSTYGLKLYNYLKIIRYTDFFKATNPISYVWNKVAPYQDEMRVYGEGLRYFLPKNLGDFRWYEHSHGVQTFHPYFESLAEQLKTRKGRYEFVKEIGRSNVKPLLKFAYYNSLDSIDSAEFLNDKFYNEFHSYDISSGIDYIEGFDFNGLANRLKKLSRKVISGEISDLETGYIYYKLRNYRKAYQEFNKVLPMAWRKGKYVLYFICLYNLYKLRYTVNNPFQSSDTFDWEAVSQRLCKINISDTLSKLQLPIEFRRIFQDLLADRYLNTHLVESEKLKEELHRQRISAENGASSINSNIVALIGHYLRAEKFCNGNFVLSDFNNTSTAFNRNVVIGILNSHATKDHRESPWGFGNTKLETLNSIMIQILITSMSFSELVKIFKQYKIKSLSLDDNGKEYVRTCIANLKGESFVPFWSETVKERIINLLFLLSLVKIEEIDINSLYSLIEWLVDDYWIRMDIDKFISGIIQLYTPTPDISEKLLRKIFSFNKVDRSTKKIIQELCDSLCKLQNKIDVFKKVQEIDLEEIEILISVAKIIPIEKKEDFYQWALPRLKKNFIYYIIFLRMYNLIPDNVDEFRSMLMAYSDKYEMNYGAVGSILTKWRNDDAYSKIWDVIDECASSHSYLKFALDPLRYEDKENVHPEWIKALDEDKIREIIKDPIYNNILIKHIATGNFSPEARLEMLSVYKDKEEDSSIY